MSDPLLYNILDELNDALEDVAKAYKVQPKDCALMSYPSGVYSLEVKGIEEPVLWFFDVDDLIDWLRFDVK